MDLFTCGIVHPFLIPLMESLAQNYAGHPYAYMATRHINRLVPGQKFIDFTAPDINGSEHNLSQEIEGRTAVLILWMSRHESQSGAGLIPLYEKYRDKDFTILGIAREFRETDHLQKVLEEKKLPWLTLVEMDDSLRIWEKYSQPLTGIGTFILIDPNGNIVAVDPEIQEIENYLRDNLR